MNKFITWLFYNSEYNKIQRLFKEASSELKEAYDLWCIDGKRVDLNTWQHKKNVAAEFEIIKSLQRDILTCKQIEKKYILGLYRFLGGTGLNRENQVYYTTIAQQKSQIILLNDIIQLFQRYPNIWVLFGEGDLHLASSSVLYSANRKLIELGAEASKINHAIELSNLYPLSWDIFISKYNKGFTKECIEDAYTIPNRIWEGKESFLIKTEKKQALVKILLGNRLYRQSSFIPTTLEIEKSILKELEKTPQNYPSHFECSLRDETKLKRLILDYTGYGDDVNFADSFTLSEFYKYRVSIDNTGYRFAELVSETKKNRKAIVAYNKSRGYEAVTYIEDYVRMGQKDTSLYKYVARYNEVERLRTKVKRLQNNYHLGFCSLLGIVDADIISIEEINNILKVEDRIKEEDVKLLEKKRRQEEEERRHREEEKRLQEKKRIEQEIVSLKKKVATWNTPSKSSVRCFALYNYYPINCDWEVDNEGWVTRNLIWDFKANPNKPMSPSEILLHHERAMMTIIPKVEKCLGIFFGSEVRKLTLVCIPSSKQEVTERRYKEFSRLLSQRTGMANGFDYITVTKDGGAKHLGQTTDSEVSINTSFFKDRYVLLFDDVITSGHSMETYSKLLKQYGATVICGVSIGQTKHNWEPDPIDSI